MKILHLISQAPDFTGSGKYIQAMLKCAARKGHQNYLVAGIQDNFSLKPSIIPEEKCRFVRFNGKDLPYPLPGMSDAMPYENTIFSTMGCEEILAYESAFKEAIKNAVEWFAPDIIHSHHLWFVSIMACEIAPHIPVVTTCHGTCLRQHALCSDLSIRIGPLCRKINRVIALSHHQKQEIKETFSISKDYIDVIPGGYDETIFYPGEKPSALPSGSFSSSGFVEILYAGKLCRAKGVPWLLKALRQVDSDLYPWRLHIAGSGSGAEKAHCLELARESDSRVVVHGALNHNELADLMRQCHIFVFPSFFEGLPLVLMEALACGCRVLTTALPSTREVLGAKSGYGLGSNISLIELPPLETVDKPFDKDLPLLEQRLACCLQQIIRKVMKEPRPDIHINRKITKPYSWDKIFERIEMVYAKALDYVLGSRYK